MPAAVELAGSHAEPPKEQQGDAEDGEDAGGPHSPCREKERNVHLCSSQPWHSPAVVVVHLQTQQCRTGEKATLHGGVRPVIATQGPVFWKSST